MANREDVTAEVYAAISLWGHGLGQVSPVEVAATIHDLADTLTAWRDQLTPSAWRETTQMLHNSVLLPLLLHDPFTRHAYYRPHGIAGDAELLDYIHGTGKSGQNLSQSTHVGRWINAALQIRPLARAIRYRRLRASEFLAQARLAGVDPSILVLGAGYLREIDPESSGTLPTARIVALEPDEQARNHIARHLPDVETLAHSVQDVLDGCLDGRVFDAAYALGVCSDLPDAPAGALLAKQTELIRPGGRALVCNFARDAADRGYMEAFMEWHLIYRDEPDLRNLAERVCPDCEVDLYRDPSRQIVFLELTKAA